MEQLLQAAGLDADTVLLCLMLARAALLVLDRVDDKHPKLHWLTNLVGTVLGGSKAR
jgi:hypothetical protein